MSILTPKHGQFDSYHERAKYLMVYRITLFFTFIFVVLSILLWNVEFYAVLSYLVALFISSVSLVYLIATQRYQHLFLFYAIMGTIVAHFSCNFSLTTSHYVDFLWMMVSSLLAFVGMGRKWGLIILSANVMGIAYFIFNTHNTHITTIKPFSRLESASAYVELLLAFFIIAYLMHQFIAFQNFSEARLRKANLELEKQNSLILSKNRDNSNLLKEIHHRVKNNLQIIISLLRLQQSDIKNPETREHFSEAINRVMVMSTIHQRLYQQKEISKVDLAAYINDLMSDLKKVFQDGQSVKAAITCEYSEIDLKTVVPLGLLLNELISNSYKYAFAFQESGLITISIRGEGDQFKMQYADNGQWQKAKDDRGFGLELIQILAEQLNGKYQFHTDEKGTRYDFVFSKLG